VSLKLDTECIRYIALFENLTGTAPRDCMVMDDQVVFVIKPGEMGLAIGKNGEHVNRVKKALSKHVEIVEYAEKPEEFLVNAFRPVVPRKINITRKEDKTTAYVEVPVLEKGLAIGKNGRNIKKIRNLAKRHHNIDHVIIQ